MQGITTIRRELSKIKNSFQFTIYLYWQLYPASTTLREHTSSELQSHSENRPWNDLVMFFSACQEDIGDFRLRWQKPSGKFFYELAIVISWNILTGFKVSNTHQCRFSSSKPGKIAVDLIILSVQKWHRSSWNVVSVENIVQHRFFVVTFLGVSWSIYSGEEWDITRINIVSLWICFSSLSLLLSVSFLPGLIRLFDLPWDTQQEKSCRRFPVAITWRLLCLFYLHRRPGRPCRPGESPRTWPAAFRPLATGPPLPVLTPSLQSQHRKKIGSTLQLEKLLPLSCCHQSVAVRSQYLSFEVDLSIVQTFQWFRFVSPAHPWCISKWRKPLTANLHENDKEWTRTHNDVNCSAFHRQISF